MIYADAETRKTWRMNYGIFAIDSARDAADYWERRGGAPSGCVLALAHAIEQIDSDEELLRKALETLKCCMCVPHWPALLPIIDALSERLRAAPKPGEKS